MNKSVRTTEELRDIRFNYFYAFKVDHNETNAAIIKKCIEAILFSPSGSLHQRRLLELKEDAMQIMCNDAVYDPEKENYIPNQCGRMKEAKAFREYKFKEAIDAISKFASMRRYVSMREIKQIYSSVNKNTVFFTEEAFVERIKSIFDSIIVEDIPLIEFYSCHNELILVGKDSLYELLEIDINATMEEIAEAIKRFYCRSNDLRLKKLCSFAQKYLGQTKEKKESYDLFLLLKDSVWDVIDTMKGHNLNNMFLGDYRILVERIQSILEVSSSDAEVILSAALRKKPIELQF